MPYPTIDPLPDVPNRSAEPEMFSDAVDSFLTALPTLQEQINDAGDYIETVGGQVDTDKLATAASASAAYASASDALVSQNLAASSANYVGLWASLTGAKAIGICTFHIGSFWRLNVPLADVTTSTPSLTNTDWQFVSGTRMQPTRTASFAAAKNAMHNITATGSIVEATLEIFTANDFFFIASNSDSTELVRILKPGVTVTSNLGAVASGDSITLMPGQYFYGYAINSTNLRIPNNG